MTMGPTTPVRGDHRVIQKILDTTAKGQALSIPAEFTRISDVFLQSGGSWVRLFQGSIDDMMQLKKVIKVGLENDYVTKKGAW